jgi:hypothetical protein
MTHLLRRYRTLRGEDQSRKVRADCAAQTKTLPDVANTPSGDPLLLTLLLLSRSVLKLRPELTKAPCESYRQECQRRTAGCVRTKGNGGLELDFPGFSGHPGAL